MPCGHLPQKVEISSLWGLTFPQKNTILRMEWRMLAIFSCGRLNRCKGHADLIAAILRYTQRREDLIFRAANCWRRQGGSRFYRLGENLIEQQLESCVSLLGAVIQRYRQ